MTVREAICLQAQVLVFLTVENHRRDLLIIVEGGKPEVDVFVTLQPANHAPRAFWTEPITLKRITKGKGVSS